MLTGYGILKLVHVLSAIVWLGGSTAIGVMTARAAGARDRAALGGLLAHGTAYGMRFAAPAMGLVLLTGIAMVGMAHLGFASLWVLWGFGGMVFHFTFGAMVLRKAIAGLSQLAASPTSTDGMVLEASRRLSRLTFVYLTLLATVGAAMVLKPTL